MNDILEKKGYHSSRLKFQIDECDFFFLKLYGGVAEPFSDVFVYSIFLNGVGSLSNLYFLSSKSSYCLVLYWLTIICLQQKHLFSLNDFGKYGLIHLNIFINI